MADQSKTEKATPKKRQDERKKGNVFISKDVVNVVSLLGIFVGLKILFPWIYINLKDLIHKFILISEHPGTLETTDFTFIKAWGRWPTGFWRAGPPTARCRGSGTPCPGGSRTRTSRSICQIGRAHV